jgi:hypothetical protein
MQGLARFARQIPDGIFSLALVGAFKKIPTQSMEEEAWRATF